MTHNADFIGLVWGVKLWGSVDIGNATFGEVTPAISFSQCLISWLLDYNVQSADIIGKLYNMAWVKADSINNKIKFAGTEEISVANSFNYFAICR